MPETNGRGRDSTAEESGLSAGYFGFEDLGGGSSGARFGRLMSAGGVVAMRDVMRVVLEASPDADALKRFRALTTRMLSTMCPHDADEGN